jgi:hypothetical protein
MTPVPLEQSFAELQRHLRTLQEALEALGTTVDEDKPTRDDVVVASRLSDDLLAVRGLLEEALSAADDACRAIAYPLDGDRTRRALTACQQHFHRFAHSFSFELARYDRMDDLSTVGRERGQEWLHWVSVVKQALEQSCELVEEVRSAVFVCWQELAERIANAAVSIQNTSIGQQISIAELNDNTATREDAP